MRPASHVPPVRDLLLVGGGHSHVQVLRRLSMQPIVGVRVTVISRELHTPYSGMLPGLIAGHYRYDEAHIDLGKLALSAGARLIEAEAIGLDLTSRSVELAGRPAMRYDVLSLNCGATPGLSDVALTVPVIPVKPIGRFLAHWTRTLDAISKATLDGRTSRLVVVGGGAGGVELALSVDHSLRERGELYSVDLVYTDDVLLPGHSAGARRRLARLLGERRVTVHPRFSVALVDAQGVHDRVGATVSGDHVLWVTGVEAPHWAGASGLATDARGFVLVDRTLRSVSHRDVYATGDVAALDGQPRPKSGVYAVREGPVLADNLARAFTGRAPRRFRAQRRALALISEGQKSATASRGWLAPHGELMWWWKDFIDRRFMARFDIAVPESDSAAPTLLPDMAADMPDPLRCGGCAAKLSSDVLARVLRRLGTMPHAGVLEGIGEDAAVLAPVPAPLVVSIDGLRALTGDPHRFGRIAAEHAMSDVFAMGAKPIAAFALVTLPLMGDAQMEEDLFQVMHGAVDALRAHDVALGGGHSMEGQELAVGFSITGRLDGEPLRKRGLVEGDALVLTKPLGTGVLLAGAMRGVARSRWISSALDTMALSNGAAATILRELGARACTDVTGFGLIGHLGEMLRASAVSCVLDAGALPAFEGALDLLGTDVRSSLHRGNARAFADFANLPADAHEPRIGLLADPQTSGGLLAGVRPAVADECVRRLRAAGYLHACVVGRVLARGEDLGRIVLEGEAT